MLSNQQLKLIGFKNSFTEIAQLYFDKKLPSKILLSGKKGIGKSIFAHHLSNLILSIDEEYGYDIKKNEINANNKSLGLLQNGVHPNFHYIEKKKDKKFIDIHQIRELNKFVNKSSFNNKLKIVLIDDLEFLSNSSGNALLKLIEEPNINVQYILVYDNSKFILETIKSRCIEFKLILNTTSILKIVNNYFEKDITNQLHSDFQNIYLTPLNLIIFVKICENLKLDIKEVCSKFLLKKIIKEKLYNKSEIYYDEIKLYIEIFFLKYYKVIKDKNFLNYIYYFNNKFSDAKKYNLDLEPIFLELQSKLLNEK